MLKIRFFSFLFLTVSLFYAQQNKLSIETEASIYSNWNTYFSYNLISVISISPASSNSNLIPPPPLLGEEAKTKLILLV